LKAYLVRIGKDIWKRGNSNNKKGWDEMNRLEMAEVIVELERRKIYFENLFHDVNNAYCGNDVRLACFTNSNAFNKKHESGTNITVNKTLFCRYMAEEIQSLEISINDMIMKL